MSATLESREYSQYFRVRLPSQATPTPAPVLSVDGRVWPVMEFYLDDLRDFGEVCFTGWRETFGIKLLKVCAKFYEVVISQNFEVAFSRKFSF